MASGRVAALRLLPISSATSRQIAPSSLPLRAAVTVHQPSQRRSVSFGALRHALPSFLAGRKKNKDTEAAEEAPTAEVKEGGSSVWEAAERAAQSERAEQLSRTAVKATFHKSSTANFKTSRRKLEDLARLIRGRGVDEGLLQLQMAHKKQAPRLLSLLALSRQHALAKGLERKNLVIAQTWTTPGPSLKRLDIKGRGRRGIKHHPSSRLHLLLAEGPTREQKRTAHEKDKWRRSIQGNSTVGGMLDGGRRIGGSVTGMQWRW